MNDLLRDKALEALELAARQNGLDMLLTSEELRKVEEAATSLRAAAPVVTADAVRDLLKVASEMLELADNWPGIAYSHNLDARARAAIAFVRAAMHSTEAVREEKK